MPKIEYCYTLSNECSSELFFRACDRLACIFPDCAAGELIREEDGSVSREFMTASGRIIVYDDRTAGYSYAVADFRLPSSVFA